MAGLPLTQVADNFEPISIAAFNVRMEMFEQMIDPEESDGEREKKALVDMVHYAISGRDQQLGDSFFIQVLYNVPTDEMISRIRLLGDIDSCFGITDDLPFRSQCSVYPVARFEDTLKKDVYLYHTFARTNTQTGEETQVSVCLESVNNVVDIFIHAVNL